MVENPFETLIIVAAGPSIPENYNYRILDDKVTFGLNHKCFQHNNFTALLWVDQDFYSPKTKEAVDNCEAVKITKVTNQGQNPQGIIKIKKADDFKGERGLQEGLYSGYLVGLYALSLGIALNFKEIYLLGYDCKFIKDATGQERSHSHNITHRGRNHPDIYRKGIKFFNAFKNYDKCRIWNVSPESAINVFPKIDYMEFTDRLKKMKPVDQDKARAWLRGVLANKMG